MSPRFRNLLILSAILRVALALAVADIPPRYDEVEYLQFGRAILDDGAAPSLWRAPGQQWLVAAGLALSGGAKVGPRLLQVALSLLTALLVYRLGRRWRGERTARWAGGFVAFSPSLIAFSHLLWSETLFGLLALAAFDRALAAEEGDSPRTAALAGALLGAAALTRSLGIALLGATVLAWALARRPKLALAAIAAAVAVVGPWSAIASSRAGRLVVVDVNAGFNVWSGNDRYLPADVPALWSVGLPPANGIDRRFAEFRSGDFWRREVPARMEKAGVTEAEGPDGELWYRARALETIAADPVAALARVPRKLAGWWAPDLFLPRHLLRDWYGPTSAPLAAAICVATWLACLVPLVGGPVALAAGRPGALRRLLVLWLLAAAAAHALAYGHPRMHQPYVPMLVLAFFGWWLDPETPPDPRRALRRGLPVVAVIAAAWIAIGPVWAGLWLAPGPRHVVMARVLAAPRGLPLPGADRLAWMLAEAEASAGDDATAERILTSGRSARDPWSGYLAALVTRDRAEVLRRLDRAAAAGGDARGPALVVRDRLLRGGPLPAERPDLPPGGEDDRGDAERGP